jgi:arylsulfatase A-like enzyme
MSTKQPNILFIITDQQSASMMSCTGNQYLKTPAMDYIAQNGIRFERSYCTDPVCCPSRFSLFTGKMPGFINLKSNDTREIIPEKIEELKKQGIGHIMKNAGYDVMYGGKQHLPEFTADELGFDILTNDERDTLAQESCDFIKQKKDRPFFLVTSFINPHDICYMALRDYSSSDESKRLIKNSKTELDNLDSFLIHAREGGKDFVENNCPPLPDNYLPQQDEPGAVNYLINSRLFRKEAREKYSEDDWRIHRYVYNRLTEMVDKKIGLLLEALKESGQEDNTVIIFTSDHGDMDSSHKLEHKTVFYNEASRIPLLVYQKGVTPPGIVDNTHLVSNGLDLIPTLYDYAGIDVPKDLEGRSFRPVAEGKLIGDWREAVKLESELGRMIITKYYKYAQFYMGDNNEQLYDLRKDSNETKNSAFLPENQDILKYHRDLVFVYGC